mmetsp:Transcript_4588/g.6970  ORF Transcript_4588/g.6970 Transcript_4588/m.6970 type:complete len:140 (+) Transcript_4588:259-678(+)
MGRALAVSKLQSIKQSISTLNDNINEESSTITDSVQTMMKKKQPSEVDASMLEQVVKRSGEIMAQIPRINELESKLEIQDEDVELRQIKNHMKKTVGKAKTELEEGNRKIKDKVGAIPEGAKILSEEQYGDSMSFVLKH